MVRGSQQVSVLKETSMGQTVLYFHPRWRQASGSAGWVGQVPGKPRRLVTLELVPWYSNTVAIIKSTVGIGRLRTVILQTGVLHFQIYHFLIILRKSILNIPHWLCSSSQWSIYCRPCMPLARWGRKEQRSSLALSEPEWPSGRGSCRVYKEHYN